MLERLWTVGVKVADLDRELDFHREVGNVIVLEEDILIIDRTVRLALVHAGDKYLHLMEETIYEPELPTPLPLGLCHLVYTSDDFEGDVGTSSAAGFHQLLPTTTIEAGFGTREVAFFRSPNGWFLEVIKVLENLVPAV